MTSGAKIADGPSDLTNLDDSADYLFACKRARALMERSRHLHDDCRKTIESSKHLHRHSYELMEQNRKLRESASNNSGRSNSKRPRPS